MTLTEAVTEVQRQGDFENDPHKGTTEVQNVIVRAYREGWSILLKASRLYFVKTATFTLAGGTGAGQTKNVSTDLGLSDFLEVYKLERDAAGGGKFDEVVWPMDILERHDQALASERNFLLYNTPATLTVEPSDRAAGDYRLWYVYKPADPGINDTLLDPIGLLDQFVIDAAVVRLMAKEETDPAAIKALKDELKAEALKIAGARFGPRTAVDVGKGHRFRAQTRRGRWP